MPFVPVIVLTVLAAAAETAIPAVLEEFGRDCARPLWPGFQPCRTPLAIFDGQRTWLVRHPSPPPEFAPAPEGTDVRVFAGRHVALRANTSVEIGGVPTAAALLEKRSAGAQVLAALLVHEAFHVDQAERHPKWGANEADLFLYPVDDAGALALRRLESAALRHGLAERRRDGAASWAARALALRGERFALLPGSARVYERATEVREGLARYLQALCEDLAVPLFPEAEFPAQAVRDRAYASGAAMALLLDRLDPDWKRRLEENDALALDELLGGAAAGAKPAELPAGEVENARRRASDEVAAGNARRAALRREVLEGPGWKLVLESDAPLFPRAFDPLNVELLGPKEVLHTRWVKLGNDSGTLEVLGRRCLTESAGAHPLFNGVGRACVELAAEPRVEETPASLKITADGVTLEFRGARFARSARTVRVTIPKLQP